MKPKTPLKDNPKVEYSAAGIVMDTKIIHYQKPKPELMPKDLALFFSSTA
jgi:hypothetical protein